MDTCITLMAEEGGNISGIFHTMGEMDVRTVMKLPWVSIASDGSAINLTLLAFPNSRNYPRTFACSATTCATRRC